MALRPPRVDMRARNPNLRARRSFDGLNVGCMICDKKKSLTLGVRPTLSSVQNPEFSGLSFYSQSELSFPKTIFFKKELDRP